ncbi:MAG: Hsp20/alpha crystallin family protein, partial [bacterium]|nr:Hsp20/alpha crystallin family protein [bacterium]
EKEDESKEVHPKIEPAEANTPAAWSTEEAEGQLTIDVYQTPTEIVIKSTIAGVEPEDIDISITNDMITVRGRRQKDEEIKSEDYFYQECYWGNFSRSIILPIDIDADKSLASLKNGILTIRLPKAEKIRTKKIKIKTE